MENFPRLVFDEAHSEAWSLRPDTARRINPVNPADASYALAAQELLRRRGHDVARPHRRPAHAGRAASRRRAGDRAPGRAGRRAHHRPGQPGSPPTSSTSSRRSSAAAAGWSCWPSATRTSTATTCRSCSAASASRSSSTTVQEGGSPAPERRDLGAGRHRRHRRPGPARRRGRAPASTAPACCPLDGAPGAQRPRRHQRHRRPGRPAAGRGAAARPRPGRGLRRLRPVRRRLDRGARPPHAVDQRRHLGRRCPAAGAGRARGHRGVRRCRRRRARRALAGAQGRGRPGSGRCSPRTARSTPAGPRPRRGAPAGRRRSPRESPRSRRASRTTPPTSRPSSGRPPPLGRRGLRRARLPRLAARLPARRSTASTACSTWSSSRCTPRTATPTATSRPSCCAWSGPSGWPSWSAPATTTRCSCRHHLRGLHPRLRHQLGGALPRDGRRARGARALHLGRHLLRPRGRPLPPGHRRPPSTSSACELPAGRRRGWSTTRSAGPGGLRAVGPDPRPHPQPRRPAVRPVHDQAAACRSGCTAWRSCAATSPPSGGREAGGRRACPHAR